MSDTFFGGGPWGGGGPNPWGGALPRLHYYALKKIWPIKDLQGQFDADLDIDGQYLDQVFYQDAVLNNEEFPDTATSGSTGLLPAFERIFGLVGTGTDAQRQAEVVNAERAVVNKAGRLNKTFYINLGIELGYTDVTIFENRLLMFIVADTGPPATQLPAPLYEYEYQWTWTIRSLLIPVADRPAWEALIMFYRPAFTLPIFVYA